MAEIENPTESNEVIAPAAARSELFRTLILCLIAVVFVRSFLFELFKIPSSSMVPTLQIGDHIVVSKFTYGLTFPFTSWEFVAWNSPKRGDVVVFVYPKDPSLYYIKRVIGVPGDKIEFKGKDLWVNGEAVKKDPIEDAELQAAILGGPPSGGKLYQEVLDTGAHVVKYSTEKSFDYVAPATVHEVAPDHFFVMGDNRDDSYDSRSWGDVPRANIRGRAQIIWLSVDKNTSWGSSKKIRWSRALTPIH